jgi:hypothetical protein
VILANFHLFAETDVIRIPSNRFDVPDEYEPAAFFDESLLKDELSWPPQH